MFFLIVLCFSKTTSAHSSIGKFKSNDSARSVTLHSDGTLSEMIHGNPEACASIIESGNPSYKDGNKKNNSLDNLEWCSKKMNMEHAVRLGLCRNDSEKMKNKNRELRSTIIQCVETGKVFESILAASIYYDVSHGTISDIVNGKTKSSKQIPYHFKIIKKGDKTK